MKAAEEAREKAAREAAAEEAREKAAREAQAAEEAVEKAAREAAVEEAREKAAHAAALKAAAVEAAEKVARDTAAAKQARKAVREALAQEALQEVAHLDEAVKMELKAELGVKVEPGEALPPTPPVIRAPSLLTHAASFEDASRASRVCEALCATNLKDTIRFNLITIITLAIHTLAI